MLNPNIYKQIADIINSAQAKGVNMLEEISTMSDHLSDSDVSADNINKQWLYNMIQNNYVIFNKNHGIYTPQMLNFVRSLQKYITEQYGSVNAYLKDNDTKVFPVFAAISAEVGYPINSENIDYGDGSYSPPDIS